MSWRRYHTAIVPFVRKMVALYNEAKCHRFGNDTLESVSDSDIRFYILFKMVYEVILFQSLTLAIPTMWCIYVGMPNCKRRQSIVIHFGKLNHLYFTQLTIFFVTICLNFQWSECCSFISALYSTTVYLQRCRLQTWRAFQWWLRVSVWVPSR